MESVIKLTWNQMGVCNQKRVRAMYCFKRCNERVHWN